MADEPITNVWGDPIADPLPEDEWTVPEDERLDEDTPDHPQANALDDETGDDLDGWTPDQYEEE